MLSMSQQASSPTPSLLKMKLHDVKSNGPGPIRKRAVKKPFFPSNEYFPLSITYGCTEAAMCKIKATDKQSGSFVV